MLKDRKILEQYLEEQCDKIVVDNEKCKSIYEYANETYDIPKGVISDYMSKRTAMPEASEYVLFILLDSINNIIKRTQNTDKYYTEKEIQYYKKHKYKTEKIKFPLVFKMIQVEEDQWVGKINIKTLMSLRKAQMINYNVNSQRTMQKIVKGGKERFKIALNQKAVGEIAEAYSNKTFIPNTITLNIPVDSDSSFYYDEESCSFVIKKLDYFDINDGYHRYIAACQVSDLYPDFDYNMELRIVNFTEDKAKQMIFQEDKKTKMRKIDSDSMNMNKAANIVVERLNESVRFNLKGLVSRNEGIVNLAEFAQLIDYFYFKDVAKSKEKTAIIRAISEITENFNLLTEYNVEYLEKKMKYSTLLAAMFCFYYFKGNVDENVCRIIEETAKGIEEKNSKRFKLKTPSKPLMTEVENIMKGVS